MPTFQFRPVGACLDLPPDKVPPDRWTAVANATFPDAVAERPIGEVREFFPHASLAAVPTGLMHAGPDLSNVGAFKGTQVYWLTGTAVGGGGVIVQQFGDAGVAVATRTPGAWVGNAALPAQITGGQLNGQAFINVSGVRNGLAYGSPGAIGALTPLVPAADDCFRAARPYTYHVVGLGLWNPVTLADFPTRVNWTSAAAPGAFPATWTPAATNEAGSVELADCRGALVDGGKLGPDFIIYAEGSTHVMTYVGGQTVMAFRGVSSSSGIFGRNCWTDLGPAHFAVTNSDVVLVDAQGVRSIADGWVRRYLFGPNGALRMGKAAYVHVLQHRARREVWICYPEGNTNYCDQALVWSMATQSWGRRTLRSQHVAGARGVTRLTDLWHRTEDCLLLAATGGGAALTDGRIWLADENDGVDFESRVVELGRADLDLGAPDRVKRVTALRPRLDSDGVAVQLQVRAGGRNSVNEAITWSSWLSYAPATDDTVHIKGVSGRFISVEVRDNGGALPWRLAGLDIDYQLRGLW